MLELSAEQLASLDELEKLQYVGEVRKRIVSEFPELAADEGFKARLEAAYRHAVAIGFVNGGPITQFLYYEAFAPGFYKQPGIDAWLRRPGQTVEQRFADLLQVVNSKLREQ